MKREQIKSSNIISAGYDPTTLTLEVEFFGPRGNSLYKYMKMPPEVYEGFLKAESKGSYLHSMIKPNYPCERIPLE